MCRYVLVRIIAIEIGLAVISMHSHCLCFKEGPRFGKVTCVPMTKTIKRSAMDVQKYDSVVKTFQLEDGNLLAFAHL